MTSTQILELIGPVIVYASIVGLLLCLAIWRWRGRRAIADALCLFPALVFIALTQYPFPDPALVDCTDPRFDPILQPFHTLQRIPVLIERDRTIAELLRDRTSVAAATNLLICIIIGMGLVRFLTHWLASAAAGFAMSLSVEITQLTGIFGIYPCPYRQFDVDDLILNVSGVVIGFVVLRALLSRRAIRQAS